MASIVLGIGACGIDLAGKEYVGESIAPNTSFLWKAEIPAGRCVMALELACHRHSKGGQFEFRVGDQRIRGRIARTEGFDDFQLMQLGTFETDDGTTEVEFRVLAARECFARIKALHAIPESEALQVSQESVELPELDYDRVGPGHALWARDFIGAPGKDVELRLETDSRYQTIAGIGGTFNEQGQALLALDDARQQEVMDALFAADGAAFSFCCLPVGASDFALSPYSLDDHPDDFEMTCFTTQRDEQYLIPYIKKAQAINPQLRFHARPWSPPAWMKVGGDMNCGTLRDEEAIHKAYAMYLCRFCEAFEELGIDIDRLAVQNEPDVSPGYAGCAWHPEQLARFITDSLKPLADERQLKSEIWAGSFQGIWKPTAQRVVAYPGVLEAVSGMAFQYNLIDNVIDFRLRHPNVRIMHTESPCHGGGNSCTEAWSLYQDIVNYFIAGAEVYTCWNMILDGHASSYVGWKQNSLLNVDSISGKTRYNHDYQVMRLFSRGIQPGARRIEAFCFGKNVLAVQNPDGTVSAFVDNPADKPVQVDVTLDGSIYPAELPARTLTRFTLGQ